MRLTAEELVAIKDCAAAVFGSDAVVRLFGSRVNDNLSGGDIDLHITAASDEPVTSRHEWRFKEALEERIGEQRVDVIVRGPGQGMSTIDRIALLTGRVLPEDLEHAPSSEEPDPKMLNELHRRLLHDALASGRKVRARLGETLAEIQPMLPFDSARVDTFDRSASLLTDSLMLQFSNLVAIVQDQLVRTILLAAGQPLEKRSRADQRKAAETIGAIPPGIDFEALATARNRMSHQYPADPDKQAAMLNEVVMTIPVAFFAYDALERHAERLLSQADQP